MINDLSDGGTYPDFAAGQTIDIYVDDSDESIVVRNASDDSLVTSGAPNLLPSGSVSCVPDFIQGPIVGGITADSFYQYCNGNDLIFWRLSILNSFPYAQKTSILNSVSCTGATCELILVDVQTTNVTSAGNDGTITVTASQSLGGSAAIQYGLSPFGYGAGQASNVFSGLSAGTYTVYVVDENNCTVQAQAEVRDQSIANYGVLYRVGYKDLNGNDGRFDIYQDGYSGSITEITSSGTPVVYQNLEKDQFDIFKEPVRASNVKVSLAELTKFQYRSLFTQNSREYLGIWSKDIGSGYNELWRGFLTPSVFSSSYAPDPDINLTFIDGLNTLSRFDFADANYVYSNKKLIKIIADALKKSDLELPIRVAINLYETNHNTTAADDPLDQTYIDQETFYNDDLEPYNYFDVVTKILTPFGARLDQWEGYWYIRRIEETKADRIEYREFDVNGDYVSNGSFSSLIEIRRSCVTDARVTWSYMDQQYDIIGAPKSIDVNSNLDLRESILENYSFDFPLNNDGSTPFWTLNQGSALTQAGQEAVNGNNVWRFDPVSDSVINDFYVSPVQKTIQYYPGDKFRFAFKIGVDAISADLPYIIVQARIKLGSYYLKENGTWDTNNDTCRFYPRIRNGFVQAEITAPFRTVTGSTTETLDIRLYAYGLTHADFGRVLVDDGVTVSGAVDGESDFRALVTTNKPLGSIYSVYSNNLDLGTSKWKLYYYKLEADNEAESEPDTIRPNDYATTTNERIWKLQNRFFRASLTQNQNYYIDKVEVDILPNGQEATEQTNINISIEPQAEEEFVYDLELTDAPRDPNNPDNAIVSSDRYIYDSLFKLSNGNPTTLWSRDGVAESTLLQAIYAKTVSRQYTTATNKISGTITSQKATPSATEAQITPLTSFIETMDGGIIYYLNGITINDKMNEAAINLIDSKAMAAFGVASGICDGVDDPGGGDDNDGGNGGPVSGGFSSGFGSGFEIIFN